MHSCCVSLAPECRGYNDSRGGRFFIIVPYRVSRWSHLLLPLQPFSVPELETFATLSRQRESTSSSLVSSPGSLWLSPVHLMVATEKQQPQPKTSGWCPFICCTHPLSGCPELPPWMHCPHRRTPTASGQIRERDGHHCVLNIPNWVISTHPVGRFLKTDTVWPCDRPQRGFYFI